MERNSDKRIGKFITKKEAEILGNEKEDDTDRDREKERMRQSE